MSAAPAKATDCEGWRTTAGGWWIYYDGTWIMDRCSCFMDNVCYMMMIDDVRRWMMVAMQDYDVGVDDDDDVDGAGGGGGDVDDVGCGADDADNDGE